MSSKKTMHGEDRKIVYIGEEHIRPHPQNPRKDLGDLKELAESIRKNGILQNLTVIPVEGEPGEYMTVIGHRRIAAGKLAGITEYPCQIVEGLSEREQLSMMLEENMQRGNLTIWEQANGFQLMLDLGETEDSIAKKTGFSKSTVRRRLNIAKLDQKVLKEKEEKRGFQMSLTDLYELEKVEDIETRNEILNKATDSRNLAYLAKNAVEQRKKEQIKALCIEKLEKVGVKPATEEMAYQLYSGKWEIVKSFPYDKTPEEFSGLEEEKSELFYLERYNCLNVVRRAKKVKKELTPAELEQKRKERNKRQLKAIWKGMAVTRRRFIEDIVSGKVPPLKDAADLEAELFDLLLWYSPLISENLLRDFFLGKDFYKADEAEVREAEEKVKGLSLLHKLLCLVSIQVAQSELMDYRFAYLEENGAKALKFYDILKKYGFSFTSEEEQGVADGNSELYEKKSPASFAAISVA